MDPMNNTNNCQLGSNGSRMMTQLLTSSNGNNNTNGQNNNSSDIRHTYTMAGIVQFLQYEWQRFELHRQQWEVCTIIRNFQSSLFF